MNIDAKAFFDAWRAQFGPLSQDQVDGLNALLAEMQGREWTDPRWWAYTLATALHETRLRAIPEFGKGAGRPYGEPGSNGQTFYGRSFPQITWEDNYKRMGERLDIPLHANPDLALDPTIGAEIMCEGMEHGLFTGKGLPDYFDADTDDPRNARRIVNGTDKASLIAGYHAKALVAVKAGMHTMKPPLVDQPSLLPNRKVGFGAVVAGAIMYVASNPEMFAAMPGVGPFVPLVIALGPAIPTIVSYMTRARA